MVLEKYLEWVKLTPSCDLFSSFEGVSEKDHLAIYLFHGCSDYAQAVLDQRHHSLLGFSAGKAF